MHRPLLGLILALTLSTATELSAESAADRAALSVYLNQALSAEDGFKDRYAAEVWLVDMQQQLARFIADPAERVDLLTQVHQQASQLNLPPELVLSVIEVESAFDRYAISRVGAQGLMQVMPFWKEEIGRGDDNLTHTRDESSLRLSCPALLFGSGRSEPEPGTGCLQRFQRQPALPQQGPSRLGKPLAHRAPRLVRLCPQG